MNKLTHEDVAIGAHQLWEDAGRPDGHDNEHWLAAEQRLHDLTAEPERSASPTPTAPQRSAETRFAAVAAVCFSPDNQAATPYEGESHFATAAKEQAAEHRHEARHPIKAKKLAPKAKPAESGKPLWNQPHSK